MHRHSPRASTASAALSAFSATSVRVLIVVLLSVGLGWLTFAVLFHEDIVETSSEDGISGAQPGRPSVKRRIHGSIGPVVKPKGGACVDVCVCVCVCVCCC
jgi:hypothetical protein